MPYNTLGGYNSLPGAVNPVVGAISFDVNSPVFSVAGGPLVQTPSAEISFQVDGPSFMVRGGPTIVPQTIGDITVSFAPDTITVTFKDL